MKKCTKYSCGKGGRERYQTWADGCSAKVKVHLKLVQGYYDKILLFFVVIKLDLVSASIFSDGMDKFFEVNFFYENLTPNLQFRHGDTV